eukprot:gnl/MRDRNA2_/MRDRNA2_77082_c0_seq1.p1 gnl/MRDRNA2_/MRDRNA2_77082_c0~~gnl/MRDRNA2_/MRDRNA2_77082_c0_seq1.p1  ORF type:complete len:579 (+),score=100.72 gnl/MRDRNA2_/MRDRNA2_77082_c0_seq1:115-1851(+)
MESLLENSSSDVEEWEKVLSKCMESLAAACANLCWEQIKASESHSSVIAGRIRNPARDSREDMLRNAIRDEVHRTTREIALLCESVCTTRVSEAQMKLQKKRPSHRKSDASDHQSRSFSCPPEMEPQVSSDHVSTALDWQDRCAEILVRAEDIYMGFLQDKSCQDSSPPREKKNSQRKSRLSCSPVRKSLSPQRSSLATADAVLERLQEMHVDKRIPEVQKGKGGTVDNVMRNLRIMHSLDDIQEAPEGPQPQNTKKARRSQEVSLQRENTRTLPQTEAVAGNKKVDVKNSMAVNSSDGMARKVHASLSNKSLQEQEPAQRGRVVQRKRNSSYSSSDEETAIAAPRMPDVHTLCQLQSQRRNAEMARKLDALALTLRDLDVIQPRSSPAKAHTTTSKTVTEKDSAEVSSEAKWERSSLQTRPSASRSGNENDFAQIRRSLEAKRESLSPQTKPSASRFAATQSAPPVVNESLDHGSGTTPSVHRELSNNMRRPPGRIVTSEPNDVKAPSSNLLKTAEPSGKVRSDLSRPRDASGSDVQSKGPSAKRAPSEDAQSEGHVLQDLVVEDLKAPFLDGQMEA